MHFVCVCVYISDCVCVCDSPVLLQLPADQLQSETE